MTAQIPVYSCIAKSYDSGLMPVTSTEYLRFIAFTDDVRGLDAPGWEIRPLESPKRLTSGHDINRFHKLFPHRLFPETRWSVYLDGNVRFAGDFGALVAGMDGSEAAVGGFWQPKGHTLEEEAQANQKWRFDERDFAVVEAQLAAYAGAGIERTRKIPTNQLLVRDHHANGFADAMSIWWSHLFEFTKRDQLSLLYALQQSGARWFALEDIPGVSYDLVSRTKHKATLKQRLRNQFRKRLKVPLG